MDTELDPQQLLNLVAIERLPLAILLLFGGWLALRFVGQFLDNMGERFTDRRLQLKKGKALLRFSVYLSLGVIVPLSVVADMSAIVPLLATLGLGVGFAFKDLLASLMSGVLLIVDEPFQVGDRVTFGDHYGEVAEIGLRSVRLITLDDNLVTIPNSEFLTKPVASGNAGALDMMVVVPVYVGAAEDFDAARRIIEEVGATSCYAFLDKPIVTVVEDRFLGERFTTVITLKAYVFDARFEKAFLTDVTTRVKRALRDAGIRTPDQVYRDLDVMGQEAAT